jgi:hypothetical protein
MNGGNGTKILVRSRKGRIVAGICAGLRDSTAMINTMRQRDPGLVILPAHGPAAASRLAQATSLAPSLATV